MVNTSLIIVSVLLIQTKLSISKNIGSLYAILGTSCYALAVVSDTYILKRYDAVSYTPIMSLFPGIVLLISKPSIVKELKDFVNIQYFKKISVYSFFYGIQAITYYMAISIGANASQIAPIFKSTIILTVILASIFLKERDKLGIKFLSAILVTIGVLLIK